MDEKSSQSNKFTNMSNNTSNLSNNTSKHSGTCLQADLTSSKASNDFNKIVIHYSLSFKNLCMVTVALPLFALLICFITAYIFQYDDIHETHCRVFNIVPSISAITGVSPQRYLWRACVALHIGPRYIIAAVYRAFQNQSINSQASEKSQIAAKRWVNIAFWLNVIEVSALGGVTYVSNVENFPVHSKLFVVFMISSLCHMIACIKALKLVAVTNNNLDKIEKELNYKRKLLILSLVCTAGMAVFFAQHRLLCHNMAFSWFALCEYIVATANMAFHLTLIYNFPTEHLVVLRGLEHSHPHRKVE